MVDPTPWKIAGRPAQPLETRFATSFDLPTNPAKAFLAWESRGEVEVRINGRAHGREGSTRSASSLTGLLRPGENTIEFRVRRSDGPPALSARLEAGGVVVRSGTHWRASTLGSVDRPPRLAGRPAATDFPDPGMLEPAHRRVSSALAATAPRLALTALLALLLTSGMVLLERRGARRRSSRGRSGGRSPWQRPERWVPLVVVVAWTALFLNNAPHLPLPLGFDAEGHLAYIDHVQREFTLPDPADGWQAYQPPLYYGLAAGWLGLLGLTVADPGAEWALRGLGWGAGVAQLLLLFGCLRRVFPQASRTPQDLQTPQDPQHRAIPLLGLLFAACLPLHLYLYHYPSNEPLAATLATATLYLLLGRIVPGNRVSDKVGGTSLGSDKVGDKVGGTSLASLNWRAGAAVGAVLGLATLTKFSAVLLLPVVLGLLGWRSGAGRRLSVLGGVAGGFLLACGWHFGRVWWRYGNPLIGNWDPALGFTWWQDPGYRTVGDFLGFGRALVEPWYAGFAGVADGLWSTLWLDGLVAGQSAVAAGPPWHTGLMAVGAWLGWVPMAAAMVGLWTVLRRLRSSSPAVPALLALLAILALTLGALGWMALRVPSYAQAKAFYAQPALVAVVFLVAVGLERAMRRRGWAARVAAFLFALWGLTAFQACWIENTPRAWVGEAEARFNAGQGERAVALLRRALEDDGARMSPPVAARAHLGMARWWQSQERQRAAEAAVRAALALAPEDPSAVTAMTAMLLREGEAGRAEQQARRTVVLAPHQPQGYRLLAASLLAQGRARAAEEALRRLLAVEPTDADAHRDLATLASARGDQTTATEHRRILRSLRGGSLE